MGSNDELSRVSIGLKFSNGREVHFKIIGMHCATCSLTVQKALLSVNGVLSASVSLANDEAVVIVNPALFDYAKALKAVQGGLVTIFTGKHSHSRSRALSPRKSMQ